MSTTIPTDEYQTILRQDLCSFAHRAYLELNPGTKFLPNWHHELVAAKLQAVMRGEIRRLIINQPPRSLKSHTAAVAFPAFMLGHNPSAQIICASYGQELANKHSLDCRNLMGSRWYQGLFPRTRLSSQKQSAQEFATTRNGFRMATSVGGVLTGRGADILILDDPLKPVEALSDTQRQAVSDWYRHSLLSHLNDQVKGAILIIMQRLHEDDLVGHVLEQEDWEVIRLPAIAEEDETHIIESSLGTRIVHRPAGEALHPEREPLETLSELRRIIGEYNFAGQYQQRPAPLGGGLVKREWFKAYIPGTEPTKFDYVIQTWDTANTPGELSDFSVCVTLGRKGNDLFALHVLRERLDYPNLKRAVRDLARRFQPTNILIEDKASGTQLIQELLSEGLQGVTRYQPRMDKIMRLHSVTSTIENGFVYLPAEAEWLADYLHELTTFPGSRYDDQTDATSQALDWVKANRYYYGLADYYQQQLLRESNAASTSGQPQSTDVILANNAATGQVIRWNGTHWVDFRTGAEYAE